MAFLLELFWSSGILTGSQTNTFAKLVLFLFWSSGILTGSQTVNCVLTDTPEFWSSGILTGSQTQVLELKTAISFGAVAF